MLPPGSVIGILGGGQLGRMLALAAAPLGYRCHVFTAETDAPAAQVTDRCTCAAYTDVDALRRFAAAIDVATYEFENIPHIAASVIGALRPVHPSPAVLAVCQDRIAEKHFLNGIGVATAPYRAVASCAELTAALDALGRPAVLKLARLGYDGKGQVVIRDQLAAEAWTAIGGATLADPASSNLSSPGLISSDRSSAGSDSAPFILEGWVDFAKELSVIAARNAAGATAAYVPVENIHGDHILRRTIVPAILPAGLGEVATKLAVHVAEALDLVGVLAVEMFLTRDDRLLVNELAPRPHNSGHWTIDACTVSQFEQCVRAIAGLPLGDPGRHADAVMENLIGSEIDRWPDLIADAGSRLHIYGKTKARPGRKMGHVTWLRPCR